MLHSSFLSCHRHEYASFFDSLQRGIFYSFTRQLVSLSYCSYSYKVFLRFNLNPSSTTIYSLSTKLKPSCWYYFGSHKLTSLILWFLSRTLLLTGRIDETTIWTSNSLIFLSLSEHRLWACWLLLSPLLSPRTWTGNIEPAGQIQPTEWRDPAMQVQTHSQLPLPLFPVSASRWLGKVAAVTRSEVLACLGPEIGWFGLLLQNTANSCSRCLQMDGTNIQINLFPENWR